MSISRICASSYPEAFTYPFCYEPLPEIKAEAERLITELHSDPQKSALFAEGKMLGVLMVRDADGNKSFLYGFSGLAGGRSVVEGFVPPIYDLTDPEGGFRTREKEISAINAELATCDDESIAQSLREKRKLLSAGLQDWLFSMYIVNNARGERLTIREVFARKGLVPPGGTGDCATPKMLQYAYGHGLVPLAMGEFWFGNPPLSQVRREGSFYPSCAGKCGPLLEFMLEGLTLEPNPLECDARWDYEEPSLIYADEWIAVADKPSGMLCVPGRVPRKSLQDWVREKTGREAVACHRLDMDTSGLVVFALDGKVLAAMQKLFAGGEVSKTYNARLVAGEFKAPLSGYIRLPLALDYYDRPRRIVDWESGKMAVTRYSVERFLPSGETDVVFHPCTGRTHQLRVHSAHPQGLGLPIKGDRLYGGGAGKLCLRASALEFKHPVTAEKMHFESSSPL